MTPDACGNSILQIVAENLAELGMSDLPCTRRRFVIRDGYCIAIKYFSKGVEAIWRMAEGVVEFYGDEGGLLRTISVGEETSEAKKAA